MKKFFLIISIFLLTACNSPQADILSTKEERQLPRLPNAPTEENKEAVPLSKEDLERQLQEINKEMQRPNISKLDMEQGWYYGPEKKYGTPESWIWIEKDNRWMSPRILETKELGDARTLCVQTAGTYTVSCIDSDAQNCEHVAESSCQCIEGSKWNVEQGCIMTNGEGEWISIPPEELTRGWYLGLPNQKKLGTPDNWIWLEGGRSSRWKHPRI